MLRKICIAAIFVALAASAASAKSRLDAIGNLDGLIARHAAANNLPETLLRRVIGKIFSMEVKGWCSEFEARNAPGREVGAEALG